MVEEERSDLPGSVDELEEGFGGAGEAGEGGEVLGFGGEWLRVVCNVFFQVGGLFRVGGKVGGRGRRGERGSSELATLFEGEMEDKGVDDGEDEEEGGRDGDACMEGVSS